MVIFNKCFLFIPHLHIKDHLNTHKMQTSWRHIPRPLLMHTSASPLIFVLLLRISWCLCFMPTSAQIINDVSAAAEDGSATSSSSGEIFELDHAIGGKDAAIAFKASADELINSEWSINSGIMNFILCFIVSYFLFAEVAPAWCSACTETIVQYCLDQRVLKDHCCCDSGHTRGDF